MWLTVVVSLFFVFSGLTKKNLYPLKIEKIPRGKEAEVLLHKIEEITEKNQEKTYVQQILCFKFSLNISM